MIPGFSDPLCQAWPFWVLELTPAATLQEVEKAARDISAKLRLHIKGADTFALPGATAARDEFLIREARARLQDPHSRLLCEFWYVVPDATLVEASAPTLTTAAWQALLEGGKCPA